MKKKELVVFSFFCLFMSGSIIFFWLFCFLSKASPACILEVNLDLTSLLLMDVSYPVVFDSFSCMFASVVCFITSWVMVYTGFYMAHELYFRRFCFLVTLFVVAMHLLIFNPSMLTLMVGWDGLGVTSFILVVYYMDSDSYGAGMLTVFSNRVGDVFFIIFISFTCAGLSFESHSIEFSSEKWAMTILGSCLLVGSITKSAQAPFCAWLPAAMAAPTPVSALVHSSTLVTAGVYMCIRFDSLLSENAKMILLLLSLFTFYLAGLSALVEFDIKKVVALSTLSQVSMMMVALSMGFCSLAFFHLVVHAFFKALMFMCVGAIMYLSGGIQDMRFLSKMYEKLPLVSSWLVVSMLCLCGLPFTSGFYSKDSIIEAAISVHCGLFLSVMILGTVMITCAYSMRVIVLLFKENEVYNPGFYDESSNFLFFSMLGLGLPAVFSGQVLQGLMIETLMYVSLDPIWKMLTWVSFLSGLFLGVYSVTYKNKHLGSVVNTSLFIRFLSDMFFLYSLSGWWTSSKSLKFIWGLVMDVENFWVNTVVWGWGFGKAVSYVGSLIRLFSSKYMNTLIFLSSFLLLCVFMFAMMCF